RRPGRGCPRPLPPLHLIAAVCERATPQGASRVYWPTREDNATAIALCEKVALRTGFIHHRIGLSAG
ncbi:MAG: hypothetical protein IM662_05495, partial [Phenylobacterium sp.]|nr:hypothetical protein [Phenylobacterium sp.]